MRTLAALLLYSCAVVHAEYVKVDDSRVYFEVGGSGSPAVVLVHGWTCDSSFWRLQRPALEKRSRVLAIDLPGHGKSDKPEAAYDLGRMARAVSAAMTQAGIDSAVLVGHSMGASVIRQVSLSDPTRVIALVSVDGAIFRAPSEEMKTRISEFAKSLRGPEGNARRTKFIDGMFTDATPPELREEIRSKMLATPAHVAASASESVVMAGVWDRETAQLPSLALNKRSGNPQVERTHKDVFANLEYYEIDGVGHFLQMEKPDEVNARLISFIKKVQR